MTSNFPGLGRYAALGSILAARTNSLAAQNEAQTQPTYMNPQVESQFTPVQGPTNALEVGNNAPGPGRDIKLLDQAPGGDTQNLTAGEAPVLPKGPGDITLPPMPASSMLRDVQATKNRTYRGMI